METCGDLKLSWTVMVDLKKKMGVLAGMGGGRGGRRRSRRQAQWLKIRSGFRQLSRLASEGKGHRSTEKDSFVIARATTTKLRKQAICFHLLAIEWQWVKPSKHCWPRQLKIKQTCLCGHKRSFKISQWGRLHCSPHTLESRLSGKAILTMSMTPRRHENCHFVCTARNNCNHNPIMYLLTHMTFLNSCLPRSRSLFLPSLVTEATFFFFDALSKLGCLSLLRASWASRLMPLHPSQDSRFQTAHLRVSAPAVDF